MNAKNILKVAPGLQATALVGENLKAVKNFKGKPMKTGLKKITNLGVKNLVGIGLIKPTSKIINEMS
jgi:hypothetical protein